MIEWIFLALVVVAVVVLAHGNRSSTMKQYCDLECRDCEGCRR